MQKGKIIKSVFIIIGTVFLILIVWGLTIMRPQQDGEIFIDGVSTGIHAFREGFVNVFLLESPEGFIAFDSGMGSEVLSEKFKEAGINPDEVLAVLYTHSDSDHIGGSALFSESRHFIHEQEEALLKGEAPRLFFGKERFERHELADIHYITVKSGELLKIGGHSIEVAPTPGHTPGSVTYVVNGIYAFAGDMALIKRGKLDRLPAFINNDNYTARKSAQSFLQSYPMVRLVLTGHDGVLHRDPIP